MTDDAHMQADAELLREMLMGAHKSGQGFVINSAGSGAAALTVYLAPATAGKLSSAIDRIVPEIEQQRQQSAERRFACALQGLSAESRERLLRAALAGEFQS